MRTILLLFAIASLAWTPAGSVDLAGGNWISCGDQPILDGAEEFTLRIWHRRKGTGWHSAARLLTGRWGATGRKQIALQVMPQTSSAVLRVALVSNTGATSYHDVPSSAVRMYGRTWYHIVVVFSRGTLRIELNGREVPLVHSRAIPSQLVGLGLPQPWTIGGPDLLQDLVHALALWPVALPRTETRALWCQGGSCDLAAPLALPNDYALTVPPPAWWVPLDGVPLAPSIFGSMCSVTPNTGNTNTSRPISPVVLDSTDPVVARRFRLTTAGQLSETRQFTGRPCAVHLGGQILAGYYRGSDHRAGASELVLVRSNDGGRTWPVDQAPFVGAIEREVLWIAGIPFWSTTGCQLTLLRSGRILAHFNRVWAETGPVPPMPWRYVLSTYSDDGGATWAPVYNTVDVGTQFAFSQGSGGRCLERADGCVSCGGYWRNAGEWRYCAGVMTSCSQGEAGSWTLSSTVACDASPGGRQYEETQLVAAGDGSWLATVRVDDTYDILGYRSWDEGRTWEPEGKFFEGANGAPCIHHGVMLLCGTRQEGGLREGVLQLSQDGGHSWIGPFPFHRTDDGFDMHMGHTFVPKPDGTLGMLTAQELVGSGSAARVEWLDLRDFWSAE